MTAMQWTRVMILAAAAACGLAGLGCSPTAQDSRDAANHKESADNLRQIGAALLAVRESMQGQLPPTNGEKFLIPEDAGHSWRFHILPYVDQGNVYKAFVHGPGRPDAWNRPQLLGTKIPVYQPEFAKAPMEGGTYYRAFVGPRTAFDARDRGGQAIGNKLLIVEAGEAVPWPKPEELEYRPNKPLPPLGGMFSDGFHGVYGDGEVRFFPKDTDETLIRAAVTGTYQGERPGRKLAK